MGRLVTREGLSAFINRNIALRKSGASNSHTYVEAFRTLDDRVPYCMQISHTFGCNCVDKVVHVGIHETYSGTAKVVMNTKRWSISIIFYSTDDTDDDEFERDIPEYAKAFRRCFRSEDDVSLLDTVVDDPPTAAQLDSIYKTVVRLQQLKACGCGNPAALSDDLDFNLCNTCELTLTGTSDGQLDVSNACLVCMQPMMAGHVRQLSCCGVELHKGCLEHHNNNDTRCPHCRR